MSRGILVAEVEIPYDRARPLRDLARIARSAGAKPPWLAGAEALEEAVDAMPTMAPLERIQAMERATRIADALPHVRPLRLDELFRVDAASSLRIGLPERILSDLAGPVGSFVRLLAAMYPESLTTASLVERFLDGHEPDTDVPFLDLYRGFGGGEAGDVKRALEFSMPDEEPDDGTPRARARRAARRIAGALAERARGAPPGAEVGLSESEIDALVEGAPEPRWTCGVLFQIAARSARDVEEGRYRLVLNSLFNGTGLALARFARLLGGDSREGHPIVAALREGWSALARPGAVLAEITYNHEARTANAGLRPRLFDHEIELPGDRGSPAARVLPLADLTLRYDRREERLVLRSRSLGCEVIPVLSSGVNPVGIVSDLVHIGRQGWQTVGYLPGFDVPGVSRWPRIVIGNLVLFRARRIFRGPEIPALAAARREEETLLEAARWRRRHDLPRRFFAHTSLEPKPFHLDLDSPPLVDLLRRAVAPLTAPGDALVVTELLPSAEESWIEGPAGRHAVEFLVQLSGPPPRSRQTK